MVADAQAQDLFGRPWTDSADPAALKTCREHIAQPSSGTKVGPLVPLRNLSFLTWADARSSLKRVRHEDVRMYAARVKTTSLFGAPIDRHDVCFFERTGKTYRFVQVCQADSRIKRLENCNLGWVIPRVIKGLPPDFD
jgi:hypothetical protein